MKKLILSSLFLSAVAFSANADEVIKASSLKIESMDGLTNVQNLTVKLSAVCKYTSGIFWPEPKSCGVKTIDLKVEADGVVQIPAIEKFSGIRAANLDNYDVSLSVTEGKEWIGNLDAHGKEALPKFQFNNQHLSIYRTHAAKINVSYEGADFFGSELSKIDRAMLLVSIKDISGENKVGEVMTVSSLKSLWARENMSSYAGKILLKDTKEIELNEMTFVKLNGTSQEKITVNVNYILNTLDTTKMDLRGSVAIPLTPTALEEIGSIELLKR